MGEVSQARGAENEVQAECPEGDHDAEQDAVEEQLQKLITGHVQEATVVTATAFTLDELGDDLLFPTEDQEGSARVLRILERNAVGQRGHVDLDGVGAASR